MSLSFEYPKPYILLATQMPPFFPDDVAALQREIAKTRKSIEHLYVISDMREIELTFSQLVEGMAQSTDGSTGYRAGDDGVDVLLVTDKEMNKRLSEFYKQEQYGGMEMPIFTSVEDAKRHIESKRR